MITGVVVKLLQDALHAVLRADRALLALRRQAGESSAEKDRPRRHPVDLPQQLQGAGGDRK